MNRKTTVIERLYSCHSSISVLATLLYLVCPLRLNFCHRVLFSSSPPAAKPSAGSGERQGKALFVSRRLPCKSPLARPGADDAPFPATHIFFATERRGPRLARKNLHVHAVTPHGSMGLFGIMPFTSEMPRDFVCRKRSGPMRIPEISALLGAEARDWANCARVVTLLASSS